MQTFLPYPDFKLSAKVLDNKRLGKQRLEAKQILEINLAKKNSSDYYICAFCSKLIPNRFYSRPCPKCGGDKFEPLEFLIAVDYKIPWENHPAVLMWRNFDETLAWYGEVICSEWISRGFEDNQLWFFKEHTSKPLDITDYPGWLGNETFHLSHQANLLRKDFKHYSKFFTWEFDTPYDEVPYFWPVTKEKS